MLKESPRHKVGAKRSEASPEGTKSPVKNKIIFIVGPTAVGKSEVAVNLAGKLNAEIISCDSMQIYRGMDILTSKPPATVLKRVPHHLIGVISAQREYNASEFRKAALEKIRSILQKGKTPLFVGGTGLYVSILCDGIFEEKSPGKNIRTRLYRIFKKQGSNYLHNRLEKVDPRAASRIHPHDARRIIRALEVYEATGKPISELQKTRRGLKDEFDIRIFCLEMKRNELYRKIDERVEVMFKKGLINEAKKLLAGKLSRCASFAIGLRELKGFFDKSYTLDEAKRLIKRNTRNYAKRQLAWFRKDKNIIWVNIKEEERPKEVALKLWKRLCL